LALLGEAAAAQVDDVERQPINAANSCEARRVRGLEKPESALGMTFTLRSLPANDRHAFAV
jgi:hypothetical protein